MNAKQHFFSSTFFFTGATVLTAMFGMGGDWEAVVTLAGQAQIRKPGWEITRQWSTMFQAIAISSRYRFAGQGSTPAEALADARRQMVLFRDELNQHLEAT